MNIASLQSSPIADLWLRPWYDRMAADILARWYFPLSRAWAAACQAAGDPARFAAAAPYDGPPSSGLDKALRAVAAKADAYRTAEATWADMVFAPDPPDGRAAATVTETRLAAAHTLMATRRRFVPWQVRRRFPTVRWRVASVDAARRRHGPRLHGIAFPAPVVAGAVQLSHPLREPDRETFWLRFDSTVSGTPDIAWARVDKPPGRCRGAVILAHGIGIETEFWRGLATGHAGILAAGYALVAPEGPYHGRRCPPGFYGGEGVFAAGVQGLLDYTAAHVSELGRLIAWARAAFAGPVGLAGISLGALTTQIVAVAAHGWSPEQRPDALLLVTASDSVVAAAIEGRLARLLGVPAAVAAAGWTPQAWQPYLPLLEPRGAPALPAERILAVLGTADEIMPYHAGDALMTRWQVPRHNVFRRRQGHFSASLGLARDDTPMRRLTELLDAGVD